MAREVVEGPGMRTAWMVRAGRDGVYIETFLEAHLVALNDTDQLGALPSSKEGIVAALQSKAADLKPAARQHWASQLFRFANEFQIGDAVVTYDQERRLYYLGQILGAYEHRPIAGTPLAHCRPVQWTQKVPRDTLALETRNTLGAIQTLFKLSAEACKDLEKNALPFSAIIPQEAEELAPVVNVEADREEELRREMVGKADDFIQDAIARLSWEQMQELVAGILRAMGYRTRVAAPGPDRGYDIFASPDGLGLQEPRIFVEVKHRKGAMGSPDLRAFLGGRSKGDRCLYVSTGGLLRMPNTRPIGPRWL